MKVIVLGSIAYDYIMSYPDNLCGAVSLDIAKGEYQSTVTASSKVQHFGGTAGNISYNLGLLGLARVNLICAVGKDFESLGYSDHISKFSNVDIGVDIHNDLFTAACYIVNDVKSNQMIVFHGGALDKCEEIDLRERIKDPENYSYAINSTQSVNAMVNFSQQLKELGIPMIFDPGQVTPLFPKELLIECIKISKILIGNKYEINQILNKTEMSKEEVLQHLSAIITTKGTDGSNLSYIDSEGKIYEFEIPITKPKEFLDSTGAGDGYRAGILTGLILNMSLLDSCRLGSIIGTFVVETLGAQSQQYTIEQIRRSFFDSYGYVPQELERV